MRKILRTLLALAACGALVFGSVNLARYIRESKESIALKEKLIEEAVVIKTPETSAADETAAPAEEAEAETGKQATRLPRETAPIGVDFHVLTAANEDIIGWLYSPDTPINLPVVQGTDNDYYLDRMIDGTVNGAGTLFVDYRNAPGFADYNTVIYGHNMKNKEIFGTLADYKEPSYFAEHPVMWLLTPDGDYKVELVAGFVTPSDSEVYAFDQTAEAVLAIVRQAIAESTFVSDVEIAEGDRFLTLSTCSYEYENARYVLIGRLTALK